MFLMRLVISVALVLYLVGCQTIAPDATSGLKAGKPVAPAERALQLASMEAGSQVVPPFGYIGFCLRHAAECETGTDTPSSVELTPEKWRELNEVNDYVNKAIRPVEDIELYSRAEWWAYPGEEGGDCEDYALLKRKLLIERGWPADALLLSVVKEWNGAGHAVLTAVTDKGDYALDNQAANIVLWKDTPYSWVKRQSRTHPYMWVNLDPEREEAIRLASAEVPKRPALQKPAGTAPEGTSNLQKPLEEGVLKQSVN
jgi:predicted transglutaminase-like cysteine proteinase